jgi:epoxyqueuosine reductase QueG
MITRDKIKEIAFQNGVDLFGIADVERFKDAPAGFNPKDVYSKTKSIIAFAIKLPSESLYAENPVPYTHVNHMAMHKMDFISYNIS